MSTDHSSKDSIPTFTEIDYIANHLYQADHRSKGCASGARWWCLRSDLRKKWRDEARRQFLEWSQAEEFTLERHQANMHHAGPVEGHTT